MPNPAQPAAAASPRTLPADFPPLFILKTAPEIPGREGIPPFPLTSFRAFLYFHSPKLLGPVRKAAGMTACTHGRGAA